MKWEYLSEARFRYTHLCARESWSSHGLRRRQRVRRCTAIANLGTTIHCRACVASTRTLSHVKVVAQLEDRVERARSKHCGVNRLPNLPDSRGITETGE